MADKTFGDAPLALGATASSGLPVTFASLTPAVCTVSGATLILVAVGTCTVRASQGGDADHEAAADVDRGFAILASAPGAPTIGVASAGDGQASVAFQPPAFTGGLPIDMYSATCNPGALTGTASASPVTVSGLANGTTYGCVVQAHNGAGAGAPSAPVNVTPVRTTVVGTTGTHSGVATLAVTGGGPSCTFVETSFPAAEGDAASPPALPPGVVFPHGLVAFATTGCVPGSTLAFVLTLPSAVPGGSAYWKFGPEPGNAAPHWYRLPATILGGGNAISFSITDGGQGDGDLTVNGAVLDPGGVGVVLAAPAAIPALDRSMLALLSASMLLVFALFARKPTPARDVRGR